MQSLKTAMSDTTGKRSITQTLKVSFESDFQTLGDPKLEHLYSSSKEFAESITVDRKHGRFLTLSGPSGCGKTHLAREIALSVQRANPMWQDGYGIRHPWTINFWKLSKLLRKVRQFDFTHLKTVESDDFAVLDDMGAAYGTEFSTSLYLDLIESRLGKWTVITTNLTFDEIADQLDKRIASRLIRNGSQFVEVTGVKDFNVR